jgi:hypothetical protein
MRSGFEWCPMPMIKETGLDEAGKSLADPLQHLNGL